MREKQILKQQMTKSKESILNHRSFAALKFTGVGRGISDDGWRFRERMARTYVDAIDNAIRESLLEFSGAKYRVSVDLSPVHSHMRQWFSSMRALAGYAGKENFHKFPDEEIYLLIEVSSNRSVDFDNSQGIVERLIYYAFLLLNISCPGMLSFNSATISSIPPRYTVQRSEITTEINLDAHHFEVSSYKSEFAGLQSTVIDIKQVADWLDRALPKFHGAAENSTQRGLFSLLYLSRDPFSPTDPIWIFYALESIYDCRVGENFGTLSKRIALFLQLDGPSAKKMKSKLRKLYDLRSGFVHGGLAIDHPAGPIYDTDDEDERWRRIKLIDLGFTILLKTI